MHPMEDEEIENIVTQFIKYEVGSEEGVIALLVERLLRDVELASTDKGDIGGIWGYREILVAESIWLVEKKLKTLWAKGTSHFNKKKGGPPSPLGEEGPPGGFREKFFWGASFFFFFFGGAPPQKIPPQKKNKPNKKKKKKKGHPPKIIINSFFSLPHQHNTTEEKKKMKRYAGRILRKRRVGEVSRLIFLYLI